LKWYFSPRESAGFVRHSIHEQGEDWGVGLCVELALCM
jgi:hypothetical protein